MSQLVANPPETDAFPKQVTRVWNTWHRQIFLAMGILSLLTIAHHYLMPKYQAKAVILVQRPENSPLQAMMGKMTSNPIFAGRKTNEYLEKYLFYLNSHEFFLRVARDMLSDPQWQPETTRYLRRGPLGRFLRGLIYVSLNDSDSFESKAERVAKVIHGRIWFRKTSLDTLVVEGSSGDYHKVVELTNYLAQAAVKTITDGEVQELSNARTFIETQISAIGGRLGNLDQAVVDYRKNHRLVQSDNSGSEFVNRSAKLRQNYETTQLRISQNLKLIEMLNAQLSKEENQILSEGATSINDTAIIRELRQRIQTLRYNRMLALAQGQSNDAPRVQEINASIDKMAKQLQAQIERQGGDNSAKEAALLYDKDGLVSKIGELQRENQYLTTNIEATKRALDAALEPLKNLPEDQQKLVDFGRNSQVEFVMLQDMRRKTLEIDLEKIALSSKVRLLEKATIPGIPPRLNVFPKILFVSLVSVVLLILAGLGYEYLNTAIKSRYGFDDLGLIHLASIPAVSGEENPFTWRYWLSRNKPLQDILKSWRAPVESPEVMAFKYLRNSVTRLPQISTSTNATVGQLLAVLGARSGHGKSFVSSNLALALAQIDKRVLLLDCDMRRPSLAKKLQVKAPRGLSDVLGGDLAFEQAVVRGVFPHLDLLAAGNAPQRATELLGSSAFSALLERLKTHYDYIVLDTPPIFPVVDSLVVAALADSLIFTVSHKMTTQEDLRASIEKLRQWDNRPIFYVYNRTEELGSYAYFSAQVQNAKTNPAVPGFDLKKEIQKFRESFSQRKNIEDGSQA